MLSTQELEKMREIEKRLDQARIHLDTKRFPSIQDTHAWYSYLAEFKSIQGNFNTDVSFVSTLMAKQFILENYGKVEFDASIKDQSATGLDIDVTLPNGKRIIAEIKTTNPVGVDDLGSNQKTSFQNDFNKLARTVANMKLFFLTEASTYGLMKMPKYRSQLAGVTVVLLPTGENFIA